MKKLLAILLAMTMVLGLAACASKTETPSNDSQQTTTSTETSTSTESTDSSEAPATIKIGGFFNFSGANADTGILDGDGAQHAIDFINENGGIKSLGGAKLELVKGDTMSDSSQAKAVAERVISENPDMVAAVGAGGSGYSVAMGTVFEG